MISPPKNSRVEWGAAHGSDQDRVRNSIAQTGAQKEAEETVPESSQSLD